MTKASSVARRRDHGPEAETDQQDAPAPATPAPAATGATRRLPSMSPAAVRSRLRNKRRAAGIVVVRAEIELVAFSERALALGLIGNEQLDDRATLGAVLSAIGAEWADADMDDHHM